MRLSVEEKLDQYAYPEPMSGCWLWTGPHYPDGYGRLWVNGKHSLAHRLQWERFNGPIPKGMLICHHCDTPPCINPDHLFLGTHTDNMRDAARKGRQKNQWGEKNSNAIFTEDQIRAIRNDNRIARLIASEYGAAEITISQIKSRHRWPHVL